MLKLEICESEAVPTVSPVVEPRPDAGVEKVTSPPLKSILKTADEHNADLLQLKNDKSSSKERHVTIQEPKDSPSQSKKKGPTPPIKSDDPITDGLRLLSESDKDKQEPSIDPTALEIHKMLLVKPLSDEEKAARIKSSTNLSGGSLPEYYDANFCEIHMSSRDFTPHDLQRRNGM